MADRQAPRDERWRVWIPAILAFACFHARGRRRLRSACIPLVAALTCHRPLDDGADTSWYGASYAVCQSLVMPRMRATLSAIMLLLTTLLGFGVGPLITGGISDLTAPYVGVMSVGYGMVGGQPSRDLGRPAFLPGRTEPAYASDLKCRIRRSHLTSSRPSNNLTIESPMLRIFAIACSPLPCLMWRAPPSPPRRLELISKGEYLARAGDCVVCHTGPGEKPFAGGLRMSTPLGDLYTTNITPDKETGIGNYSFEDFEAAMRHGIAKDGHRLYPAMPYPSYAKVSDDDLRALYAFFMESVTPASRKNQPTEIPRPLNWRWPLTLWDAVFQRRQDTGLHAGSTAMTRRGICGSAYLVQGLGHCGSCHTPRGIFFQEKRAERQGSQKSSVRRQSGRLVRLKPARGHECGFGRLVRGGHRHVPEDRAQQPRIRLWHDGRRRQ